jgi:hypothetical protein
MPNLNLVFLQNCVRFRGDPQRAGAPVLQPTLGGGRCFKQSVMRNQLIHYYYVYAIIPMPGAVCGREKKTRGAHGRDDEAHKFAH